MISLTARHEPGLAGGRTFRCTSCGFPITLLEGDLTPPCPRCGADDFSPDSIFCDETERLPIPPPEAAPAWLAPLRRRLAGNGPHLVWEGTTGVDIRPIPEGITRIGRSLRADLPLIDPTVSRRHALLHRDQAGTKLVDDHSLNGVFVDGVAVDWLALEDGNELELGAFRLHFVDI